MKRTTQERDTQEQTPAMTPRRAGERKPYEPPRAIRLIDVANVKGICETGSDA